ncbi:signal peptidase I [Rhodococcus sp. As11]|uniref:signal peptidase I n=1 Tax=Rhodococcus sp. As11 TaxID=3029189 RepID=UPI003B80F170
MTEHAHQARPPRRGWDTLLTIGAVLGSLCILVAAVSALFGLTPLIFRSGSMAPAIPSGSLAIAHTVPAADLRSGDVVSVINDQGSRITHRIVEVQSFAGNTALLRLQGDANPEPDPRSYGVSSAERVLFHVDGLGYLAAWLRTVPGLVVLAILAAALIRIAVRPDGSPLRNAQAPVTPLAVLVVVSAVGLSHTPGTDAAFVDNATARSGAFASKSEYVPQIAGTVGCNSKLILDQPDPVTLNWTHLGSPYQYRIILRDMDGRVWRTVDITDITAATGGTISYDLYGTGLPRRSLIWRYNAEIHTMLPGGTVSAAWRGRLVSQPVSLISHNQDLNCSPSGERDGTPAYVAPPASVACSTTGTGSATAATLTWPHVGTGVTYQVTVRNPSDGNFAYVTTVTTTPTAAGQPVTARIARTNLDTALITANTADAEIRSIQGDSYSTGFVAYRLDTTSTTGVTCSAPATGARSLPQSSASTTTTSTTSSPTASPGTSTSLGPTTTEGSPSTSGSPSAPTETEIVSALRSPSGLYSARLVRSEAGTYAVITAATGSEEYRTGASEGDGLAWAAETDELRITGSSGEWVISRASGSWVRSAVVDPLPAPPPAPAPEPAPTGEPAPSPVPEETPPEPAPTPSDDAPVGEPADDGSEG